MLNPHHHLYHQRYAEVIFGQMPYVICLSYRWGVCDMWRPHIRYIFYIGGEYVICGDHIYGIYSI